MTREASDDPDGAALTVAGSGSTVGSPSPGTLSSPQAMSGAEAGSSPGVPEAVARLVDDHEGDAEDGGEQGGDGSGGDGAEGGGTAGGAGRGRAGAQRRAKPSTGGPPARGRLGAGSTMGEVEDTEETKRGRWLLGIAYMLSMGICGIVLVAIGSNLDDLAKNCHTTATRIGTVFIARGCGAIFGALASAKLYRWFPGNTVMTVVLVVLSGLIMSMPVIREVSTMHIVFTLLGVSTSIIDTGCQIMTRKTHGAAAGPWLGVNTVVFSVSGALVPVIGLITNDLMAQSAILAVIVWVGVLFTCIPKAPDKLPPPPAAFRPRHTLGERRKRSGSGWTGGGPDEESVSTLMMEDTSCPFVVEFLASWQALWLIGGKVAATSYFKTYVYDTHAIAVKHAGLLIVMLWIGISVGRIIGIYDQLDLPTPRLYRHVYIQLYVGALAMLLVCFLPENGTVLWAGVITYGIFNGPTIGYIYDLCNRTTAASEKGMSIVMFGLNFGASMIPYLVSFTWSMFGPVTLPFIIMLSHALPIPALWVIGRTTVIPGMPVTHNLAWHLLLHGSAWKSKKMEADGEDHAQQHGDEEDATEESRLLANSRGMATV